jgi:basic membrane lipoprotein Med (substrate-binding protein (PBP1-ABC) superfamily)
VLHAAQAVENGTFAGGNHVGTIDNGEVGLSPFYDNQDLIPDAILADLERIRAGIAEGTIQTKP